MSCKVCGSVAREEFYREYPEFNYMGSPTSIMEQIVTDDFESRTCENCKYVEYGDYMCCSLTDNAFSKGNRIFKAIVNDKISCTIYEAKEESK